MPLRELQLRKGVALLADNSWRTGSRSWELRCTQHTKVRKRQIARRMHVWVVVLGDIGRSPRMQYHAYELAAQFPDCRVTLFGYRQTDPHPRCFESDRVHLQGVSEAPDLRFLPSILRFFLRMLFLFVSLLLGFFQHRSHPPRVILMQNPPMLPTVWACWLAARLVGAKLVIDWHNLTHSLISAPSLRTLVRSLESSSGLLADAHLTVTRALQEHLVLALGSAARIRVVYDRPASIFRPLPAGERPRVLESIDEIKEYFAPSPPAKLPLLIVSATSWTPDEDIQLLLDAVCQFDEELPPAECNVGGPLMPSFVFLITGKGPLRAAFERKIADLSLSPRCVVCTAWLRAGDYPRLMGCADLGVSLHTSSSGLDLPMKVLDMFGGGAPVLAADFRCLGELVRDGENGLVFSDAPSLANCLRRVLLPDRYGRLVLLSHLRSSVLASDARCSFSDEWSASAKPLFAQLLQQ